MEVMPSKREKTVHSWVIEIPSHGLAAKEFSYCYYQILESMKQEGVDLSYDDCFTVTTSEDEIVFTYTPNTQPSFS